MPLVIAVEDPQEQDVRALIETHVRFSLAETPSGYAFVLPVDGLVDPDVTLYGARLHGELVGMGALRRLDESHVELKSMHVREAVRGTGVGGAVLEHLLDAARQAGYRRVSLETGTMDMYLPARTLYASRGFRTCPPFGEYDASPYNTFMTMDLT